MKALIQNMIDTTNNATVSDWLINNVDLWMGQCLIESIFESVREKAYNLVLVLAKK